MVHGRVRIVGNSSRAGIVIIAVVVVVVLLLRRSQGCERRGCRCCWYYGGIGRRPSSGGKIVIVTILSSSNQRIIIVAVAAAAGIIIERLSTFHAALQTTSARSTDISMTARQHYGSANRQGEFTKTNDTVKRYDCCGGRRDLGTIGVVGFGHLNYEKQRRSVVYFFQFLSSTFALCSTCEMWIPMLCYDSIVPCLSLLPVLLLFVPPTVTSTSTGLLIVFSVG